MLDLRIDDILQLRKRHPCGSDQWRVARPGADIRIQCLGCGRRVLLPRNLLERMVSHVFESRQRPRLSGAS